MSITLQSTIYLLVALVVMGVIYMLVDYVIRAIPIVDPLGRIIRIVVMVICVVVAVILLLQWAGLMGGSSPLKVSVGHSPHGLLYEVASLPS